MTLTAIAEEILARAKEIDEGVSRSDAQCHREEFLDLLRELEQQILGPSEWILKQIYSICDFLPLRAIYHYNLAQHVPDQGVSFAELAVKANLDEDLVTRLIRAAIVTGIFAEPELGIVRHTEISSVLRDEGLHNVCGFYLEDIIPSLMRSVDAFDKWPGSREPTECGFNLAHEAPDPFYLEVSKSPLRSERAGKAMKALGELKSRNNKSAIRSKLWRELDTSDRLVVDVGGNKGHTCVQLAKVTKNLHFIVEDLPSTVENAEQGLPADYRDRISFKASDFFERQPVLNADVYFFRMIFHDWPDKYCTKILQNTIPALKPGSCIVINDRLLPERGAMGFAQRMDRTSDMIMLGAHNSKERTRIDWINLFSSTDARFKVEFESWPDTPQALIIAVWCPHETETNGKL